MTNKILNFRPKDNSTVSATPAVLSASKTIAKNLSVRVCNDTNKLVWVRFSDSTKADSTAVVEASIPCPPGLVEVFDTEGCDTVSYAVAEVVGLTGKIHFSPGVGN